MTNFSRNFTLLLESLRKNYPIIEADLGDEDSRGKKLKRVERKRSRLEGEEGKEFLSRDGDEFKLRPYLKVLEILRDQIIAERVGVVNTVSAKGIGSKYATPIQKELDSLLQKISSLITDVKTIYDKENGRLEVNGEDSKTVQLYTSQYKDLQERYKKVALEWKNSKDKELEERPIDQENQEIQKELDRATKLFDEAKTIFINNTVAFSGSKPAGDNKVGSTETKDGAASSEVKLTKELKKSDVKGKSDPVVKYIQSVFIKIYNSQEKLKALALTKKATKYGADGKWGPTTSQIITVLKGMMKKLDNLKNKELGGTDAVTQDFIDGLTSILKVFKLNENSNYYTENESSASIKTFESFMKERFYRTNEGELEDLIDAGVEAEKGLSSPVAKKEKVVVKKSDAVDALVKNQPEVKVNIKPEDVEKMMQKLKDEAKDEAKSELKKEDLVSALKKIPGVQVVSDFDSGKSYKLNPKKPMSGYLAKCKGLRFFENGICVITYSGELGTYNTETGFYRGKTGWREKVTDLIKSNGTPKKYRVLTKKIVDAAQNPPSYEETFEEMTKYPTSTVKTILKSSKYLLDKKGTDLFDLIRDASKKYDYVKKFYDKNRESFKELA